MSLRHWLVSLTGRWKSSRHRSAAKSTRGATSRRRRRAPGRFGNLETLEQRSLMAGDLVAAFDGHALDLPSEVDSKEVAAEFRVLESSEDKLSFPSESSLTPPPPPPPGTPIFTPLDIAEPVEDPLNNADPLKDPLENSEPLQDPLENSEPLQDPLENSEPLQDPLENSEPIPLP